MKLQMGNSLKELRSRQNGVFQEPLNHRSTQRDRTKSSFSFSLKNLFLLFQVLLIQFAIATEESLDHSFTVQSYDAADSTEEVKEFPADCKLSSFAICTDSTGAMSRIILNCLDSTLATQTIQEDFNTAQADIDCTVSAQLFEATIAADEYPTHLLAYLIDDRIKGFLIRTTQNVYDIGGQYNTVEQAITDNANKINMQGAQIKGQIYGFNISKANDGSRFTAFTLILDAVDDCWPNLTSPILAFTDTPVSTTMYLTASLDEYTIDCQSRLMQIDASTLQNADLSTTEYVFNYTPDNYEYGDSICQNNGITVTYQDSLGASLTVPLIYLVCASGYEVSPYFNEATVNQQVGASSQFYLYTAENQSTPTDSYTFCANQNGFVPQITSEDINNKIKGLLTDFYPRVTIGVDDLTDEGTFRLSDSGTIVSYTDWITDHPLNLGADFDCVVITSQGWENISCSDTNVMADTICEIPAFRYSKSHINTGTSIDYKSFIHTYTVTYDKGESGSFTAAQDSDCIQVSFSDNGAGGLWVISITCTSDSDVGHYQYKVSSQIVNMPTVDGQNPFEASFYVNIWPSCVQLAGPVAPVGSVSLTRCASPTDFSSSLCQALAEALGKQLGGCGTDSDTGEEYEFVSNHNQKGCFGYQEQSNQYYDCMYYGVYDSNWDGYEYSDLTEFTEGANGDDYDSDNMFRPEGWPGCANTEIGIDVQITNCSGSTSITGQTKTYFEQNLAYTGEIVSQQNSQCTTESTVPTFFILEDTPGGSGATFTVNRSLINPLSQPNYIGTFELRYTPSMNALDFTGITSSTFDISTSIFVGTGLSSDYCLTVPQNQDCNDSSFSNVQLSNTDDGTACAYACQAQGHYIAVWGYNHQCYCEAGANEGATCGSFDKDGWRTYEISGATPATSCNDYSQCDSGVCENNICIECSIDTSSEPYTSDCQSGYWCSSDSSPACYQQQCTSESECTNMSHDCVDYLCVAKVCSQDNRTDYISDVDCRTNLCNGTNCIQCQDDGNCVGSNMTCETSTGVCTLTENCQNWETVAYDSCTANDCSSSSDCNNAICENSICRACTDQDCSSINETCNGTTGECDSISCTVNDSCTSKLCQGEYCIFCDSTTPCTNGYACNEDTGICDQGDCTTDGDCDANRNCNNDLCEVQQCAGEGHSQCRSNYCSSQVCELCTHDNQCSGTLNLCNNGTCAIDCSSCEPWETCNQNECSGMLCSTGVAQDDCSAEQNEFQSYEGYFVCNLMGSCEKCTDNTQCQQLEYCDTDFGTCKPIIIEEEIIEEVIQEEKPVQEVETQELLSEDWNIEIIGYGDCNEEDQEEVYASTGLECAITCADSGYWMASYNGTCFCEFNLEDDEICDSFTHDQRFVLYKMTSKDPDYIIVVNSPPTWNLEKSRYWLDPEELDFADFSLETLNFVEDPDESDQVTITANLNQAAIIFDFNGNHLSVKQATQEEFQVAVDTLHAVTNSTTAFIELTATDSFGEQTSTSLDFYFEAEQAEIPEQEQIQEDTAQEQDPETNDQDTVTEEPSTENESTFGQDFTIDDFIEKQSDVVPKAYVSGIDTRGKVEIAFNTQMNFPDDFAEIVMTRKQEVETTSLSRQNRNLQQDSSNYIDVVVILGEGQIEENVQFDWDITMISKKQLEVQMHFDKALYVSTSQEIDQVNISFNNPSYFQSANGSKQLELNQITQVLPTQQPLNCTTCDVIESVGQTMKTAAFTSGVSVGITSFFMSAVLNLFFGIINMLQMYVHFPLFDIVFPGNIFQIGKIFIGIAQLDLFTDDALWEDKFNYRPVHGMEEFNKRFALLSYESRSMIYNLGDLSILQFWIFIQIILLGIFYMMTTCKCCIRFKNKGERWYASQKLSLMYNWPLRFLIEAYLEFTVSALLKFEGNSLSVASAADTFDSILAIFYLTMVCGGPVFHVIFFTYNIQKLEKDETFMAKYETVFDGLKIDRLANLYYNAFFMLRRLIFVLTCIFFSEKYGGYSSFQIFISMIMTLFLINYLTVFKPHKDPENNNSEVFTELCTLSFIYIMLLYTNFVHDPEIVFNIGFVSIGIFLFNILVNLLRVVRITYLYLKQQWALKKQKIKAWCAEKGCMKKVEHPGQKYADNQQVKDEEQLEEPTSGVLKVEFFPGQQTKDDTSSDLAICQQIAKFDREESSRSSESSDQSIEQKIQGQIYEPSPLLDAIQEEIDDSFSTPPQSRRLDEDNKQEKHTDLLSADAKEIQSDQIVGIQFNSRNANVDQQKTSNPDQEQKTQDQALDQKDLDVKDNQSIRVEFQKKINAISIPKQAQPVKNKFEISPLPQIQRSQTQKEISSKNVVQKNQMFLPSVMQTDQKELNLVKISQQRLQRSSTKMMSIQDKFFK